MYHSYSHNCIKKIMYCMLSCYLQNTTCIPEPVLTLLSSNAASCFVQCSNGVHKEPKWMSMMANICFYWQVCQKQNQTAMNQAYMCWTTPQLGSNQVNMQVDTEVYTLQWDISIGNNTGWETHQQPSPSQQEHHYDESCNYWVQGLSAWRGKHSFREAVSRGWYACIVHPRDDRLTTSSQMKS